MLPRPDSVLSPRAPIARVAASFDRSLEPLARAAQLARRADDPARCGDGDAGRPPDLACDSESHALINASTIQTDSDLPLALALA